MPARRFLRLSLCVLLILAIVVGNAASAVAGETDQPTPPEQASSGPGGAASMYAGIVETRVGKRPTGYHLFEPALMEDGEPVTTAMPLVIFLHGFSAVDPIVYQGWIDHIVQRGAVVVYPDYQTVNPFTLRPDEYLQNTLAAVRGAIAGTASAGRTPIDQSRVAVVGHSVGGVLAANYAAVAAREALPVPSVVMSVEPGGCRGCEMISEMLGVPLEDFSTISSRTRAVVLVGEDDDTVGTAGALEIWNGMTQVPLEQRDFVVLRSDDHGKPDLVADHFMPQTRILRGEADALDWYGTWKFFDLLTSCAFTDLLCQQALGNTPAQRYMGVWSDGVPVVEPVITKDPSKIG